MRSRASNTNHDIVVLLQTIGIDAILDKENHQTDLSITLNNSCLLGWLVSLFSLINANKKHDACSIFLVIEIVYINTAKMVPWEPLPCSRTHIARAIDLVVLRALIFTLQFKMTRMFH